MVDLTKITPAQIAKHSPSRLPWKDKLHKEIIDAVIRNEGNRNAASRELGIHRHTVYRHMSRHWQFES